MQTTVIVESKYLSAETLAATLGLKSRSTLHNWVRAGVWPRPVSFGRNVSRWPVDEVRAVCDARAAGKSADEVRALVSQIHMARGTV